MKNRTLKTFIQLVRDFENKNKGVGVKSTEVCVWETETETERTDRKGILAGRQGLGCGVRSKVPPYVALAKEKTDTDPVVVQKPGVQEIRGSPVQ